MSNNHTHDGQRLEQIDTLLTRHQPSGDELLDALAGSQPAPDRKFSDALENQLLQALTADDQTEIKHMQYPEKPKHDGRKKKSTRTGIRIAAAVVMVILGAAGFFVLGYTTSQPVFREASPVLVYPDNIFTPTPIAPDGIMATATALILEATQRAGHMPTQPPIDAFEATSTQIIQMMTQTVNAASIQLTPTMISGSRDLPSATPLPDADRMSLQPTEPPIPAGQDQRENSVPVIVALRDIAAGIQITPDMLGVMYAPRTIASESDFTIVSDFGGFFGNIEDVQYMYTTRPIARFQPIQPLSISADPILRNVDGQVQASAPDGMVTVNLQVAERDIFRRIQALEHVAIVAADQNDNWTWDLDWRTGEESLVMGVIVSDALVLSTQISEGPNGDVIRSITIAVSEDIAPILGDMISRQTPFVVIPQD